MLKICLSGCSFCVLLSHSNLFPKDAKYWMPRIIRFNKCVCDFYHIQAVSSVFVDMKDNQMVQLAVKSARTEVRFDPLHGRKWLLTDCISSRHDKENFPSIMTWDTKVFILAVNDCTNSTSSFALSIVDSGKCLRVSSCAFNLPSWSHLYTTEGLHPGVPPIPLLIGNVKTIPVYFWIQSSLFVRIGI